MVLLRNYAETTQVTRISVNANAGSGEFGSSHSDNRANNSL